MLSLPLRGAWIEIRYVAYLDREGGEVAPFAGGVD